MDRYKFWRDSLAGNVDKSQIRDGEPLDGFYRLREKNKQTGEVTFKPVAYWIDASGVGRCLVDGAEVNTFRACELWTWVALNPIASDVYKKAVKFGEWPDVHPAAQTDRVNSANAPDPDSIDAVKDSVENLTREAEELIAKGAATSQAESDQAADLADRLRKLEMRADTLRKAAIEPLKVESRRIDSIWNPLRDRAEAAKSRLKAFVITPFLKAKAAEADRLRAEAIKAGDTSEETAAKIDKASRTVAGVAAKAALREFKTAKITDYPKALAYFAENEKVRELVQQLANAAVRAGTVPDGCELNVERRAA